MKIIVFATGNEISSGKSIDTNSPFLAETLTDLGFSIKMLSSIPDDFDLLKQEILHQGESKEESILIMTGGLGATGDDHTLNVVLDILKCGKKQDRQSSEKLKERAEKRGGKYLELLPKMMRQTFIPEPAEVLPNEVGIAPGFFVRIHDHFRLAAMPGVPAEMKAMFTNFLLPKLINESNKKIHYHSATIWNCTELAYQTDFIEKNSNFIHENQIVWGVTAKPSRIKISFLSDKEETLNRLKDLLEKTYSGSITPEIGESLHSALIDNSLSISTAESCTGGFIAKLLTDTPGSSAYFPGSIVTYSNEMKINLLNVSRKTLESFGAVSEDVAREMVAGCRKLFGTDYSIAVTGIAGPTGETETKKLGTVYIAIQFREENPIVYSHTIPLGREFFRESVSQLALYYIYKNIKERFLL